MLRVSVRSSRPRALTAALAAAGAGLGFLAGFFARGLVGEVGSVRFRHLVGQFRRPGPPLSGRDVTRRVAEAFARDSDLAALELEVLLVRGGRLELHGWVPTRQTRARALRLATETLPGVELTNRLRVRGEDEPLGESALDVERRPA